MSKPEQELDQTLRNFNVFHQDVFSYFENKTGTNLIIYLASHKIVPKEDTSFDAVKNYDAVNSPVFILTNWSRTKNGRVWFARKLKILFALS